MLANSEASVFGHYRVLLTPEGRPVKLGEGAMGVTYLAEDEHLKLKVALKVVHPSLLGNEEAALRFQREAQAAAQLRHPNVAAVFHLGAMDDAFFYAMEYVAGETLRDRMARTGPLPLHLALQVVLQVCAALSAAEKQSLVHRDIKPANIMVEEDEDQFHIKLIDFGLAKPLMAENQFVTLQTLSGVFLGTPVFASPEQVQDQPLDIRSDFYSLGLTLWYILVGRLAFEGPMMRVFYAQVNEEPPWKRVAHLPPEVQDLLRRLLAKDPAKRPQNTRELRHLTTACLGIESVSVRADAGWKSAYNISATPKKQEWGDVYDGEGMATGRVQLQHVLNSAFASPNDAGRLIEEAVKAEKVAHPNIQRVHSAFHSGDATGVVLVTEPMASASLKSVLHERKELTPDEAFDLFRCLGGALDTCISNDLLSLDLNASAVGLVPADAGGGAEKSDWVAVPKLAPFSIQPFLAPHEAGGASDPPSVVEEQEPEELVRRLAMLMYECVGGPDSGTAGAAYVDLPQLSQAQNSVLKSCIVGEEKFDRAADLVAAFGVESPEKSQTKQAHPAQSDGGHSTVRLFRVEISKTTRTETPASPVADAVDASVPPSALVEAEPLPPEAVAPGPSEFDSLQFTPDPARPAEPVAAAPEPPAAPPARPANAGLPPAPRNAAVGNYASVPPAALVEAVPVPVAPTIVTALPAAAPLPVTPMPVHPTVRSAPAAEESVMLSARPEDLEMPLPPQAPSVVAPVSVPPTAWAQSEVSSSEDTVAFANPEMESLNLVPLPAFLKKPATTAPSSAPEAVATDAAQSVILGKLPPRNSPAAPPSVSLKPEPLLAEPVVVSDPDEMESLRLAINPANLKAPQGAGGDAAQSVILGKPAFPGSRGASTPAPDSAADLPAPSPSKLKLPAVEEGHHPSRLRQISLREIKEHKASHGKPAKKSKLMPVAVAAAAVLAASAIAWGFLKGGPGKVQEKPQEVVEHKEVPPPVTPPITPPVTPSVTPVVTQVTVPPVTPQVPDKPPPEIPSSPPPPPPPTAQDLFHAAQAALAGGNQETLRTAIGSFLEKAGSAAAAGQMAGAKNFFTEVSARYKRGDLGPRPASLPAWDKALRTAAEMNVPDALASLGDDLVPAQPEEAAGFAEKWLGLAAKELPTHELISESVRVAEQHQGTSAASFARELLRNQFEPWLSRPPDSAELTALRPLLEKAAKLEVVPALAFLGNEAVEKGDRATAVNFLNRASELGHAPSMNKLGLVLADKTQSGQPDLNAAAAWFEKAADTGYAPARFTLGECYLYGKGVPRDPARAFSLLQAAAEARVPEAHYLLGSSLLNSKPDVFAPELTGDARFKQARGHLERALELGDELALPDLALMNMQGLGTARNISEGLRLLMQGVHSPKPVAACVRLYGAILSGDSPLTETELKELKLTVNPEEASKLFVQAARLGDEKARDWCRNSKVPY